MADHELAQEYPEAVLGTLSCQIGLRPSGAPRFVDLAPALREVRREGEELVVTYEPEAAPALTELVAAERLCCAEIGWNLEQSGAVLRVIAAPAQLSLLEQLVSNARPE